MSVYVRVCKMDTVPSRANLVEDSVSNPLTYNRDLKTVSPEYRMSTMWTTSEFVDLATPNPSTSRISYVGGDDTYDPLMIL